MGAAIDLQCARAGLRPAFVPEVEPRLVAFEGEPGGPSWLAALEEVVEAWLAAGELDGVREAVARMEAGITAEPRTSHLGRGTAAYLRSRLLSVEGAMAAEAVATARSALGDFTVSRAPWWISKALRVLDAHGALAAAERSQLADIEHRLGVVGG